MELPKFTSFRSLQISDWLARFEEGRTKAMSRARPRALLHLKEEDQSFWESDTERRPPPILDLQEAKEYNNKPLELPVMKDSGQRPQSERYRRPYKRRM